MFDRSFLRQVHMLHQKDSWGKGKSLIAFTMFAIMP